MAILNQATDYFGYDWDWVDTNGLDTEQGKQFGIRFTKQHTDEVSVGDVYGRPFVVSHVARESALIRALHYIDTERGYTIGDINWHMWLLQWVNVNGPIP